VGVAGSYAQNLGGDLAAMVDTQQPEALAIIGVFLGVSTFFVFLRIWARAISWQNEGHFDTLMMWSKLPVCNLGSSSRMGIQNSRDL
jgi:hypothetical protein